MVSRAAASLTKIGFRRDLKLFLLLLVGFFVIVAFVLLLLLQSNATQTEAMVRAQWDAAADTAAAEIREALQNGGDVEAELLAITARSGFAGAEVGTPGRTLHRSGFTGEGLEAVERRLGAGTARLYFDPSPLEALRRRIRLTAWISAAAMAGGIVLLLLYVPRIVRPIDAMLEDAAALGERDHQVDEASYLIDTFRGSIAALKRQEAELKLLHEREKSRADDLQSVSSTLTRSLGSGLITFDTADRIVEMNAAARTILGVDADAAVEGADIAGVIGDNVFSQLLGQALARGEVLTRREIEIPREGESPLAIGVTTVKLLNDAGRFLGTLALFSDLSPVRRLESRLREMQTLADLGEMSAGIAHEFRNSLSTILGLLRLAGRIEAPPEVSAKLEACEREAKQLSAAVDRLLQFARPMHLEDEDVDLEDLLSTLAAQLRQLMPNVAIELRGESTIIRGDRELLTRAFDNVLRNAAEASGDGGGGSIVVRVAGEPHPSVSVTDDGPGVAQEEAAKVFLPFYSTKPAGVGIGLPLARKIILLHGGSLRFDSRPGEGTTVKATFDAPRDSAHAAGSDTFSPTIATTSERTNAGPRS